MGGKAKKGKHGNNNNQKRKVGEIVLKCKCGKNNSFKIGVVNPTCKKCGRQLSHRL